MRDLMKNFLDSINNFIGEDYFLFFENENVDGSGPWMVSDIVFGFTYLKLIDSALKYSKENVLKEYEKNKNSKNLKEILKSVAVYPSGETLGFYNYSQYDLDKICEMKDCNDKLHEYINGFSENIKDVFNELDFDKVLEFLNKTQMTLPTLKTFNEANFDIDCFSSYKNFIRIFQEFLKNIWHDEIFIFGRDPIANHNPLTSYHYIHEVVDEYGSFLISLLLNDADFKNYDTIKIYDPDSSGTYILEDVKKQIEINTSHEHDVKMYGKSKRIENRLIYLAKKSIAKKDPYEMENATILDVTENIFSVEGIDRYEDFNFIVSNYLYNDLDEYKDIFEIFKRKSDDNTKLVMALNNLDDFIDDLENISKNDNLEALISFKNHYIVITNLNKSKSRKGHFVLIDESDPQLNDEEIDRETRESFSNNNFDILNMKNIKPLSDRDLKKMKEILDAYQKFYNSEDSILIKNEEYDNEMVRILLN